MKTKTPTRKLALIVASAIGLSVLSVSPAFAVNAGNTTVTAGDTTLYTIIGKPVSTSVKLQTAGVATEDGTFATLTLSNESGPATQTGNTDTTVSGSFTFVEGSPASPYVAGAAVNTKVGVTIASATSITQAGDLSVAGALAVSPASAAIVAAGVSFTPSVAGTYTYQIIAGAYSAGAVTITVVASSTTGSGAGEWDSTSTLDCESGYVTSVVCYGIVGGKVVVDVTANNLPNRGTTPDYYIEVSGATITAVDTTTGGDDIDFGYGSNVVDATTTTLDWPTASTNQGVDADGLITVHSDGTAATAGEESFTITSAVAGNATIKMWYYGSAGEKVTFESHTVTWLPAATIGVSQANSSFEIISDNAGSTRCAAQSSGSTDRTYLATYKRSTQYFKYTADANAKWTEACLILRDGNDVVIAPSTVVITTSVGSIASGGTVTRSTTSPTSVATGVKSQKIYGDALSTGAGTVSAIATDAYGNSVSFSVPITFYGALKTLTATQVAYAAPYGDATYEAADYTSTTKYKQQVVNLTAKDKDGNAIDLNRDANSVANTAVTIDSSATAGAPAARSSDTTQVSVATLAKSAVGLTFGAAVDCSTALVAQKVNLTFYGKDADGNWVASNSVDYYCSDTVAKVAVTATSSAINVSVTDANGYPVADGTTVSLAATNGSVVAPASKSTVNGKFTTAATFIASSTAASSTVTAIAGSVSGTSAAIAGTGTSATTLTTKIDALNAKIVALNALIAKIMKKLGVK